MSGGALDQSEIEQLLSGMGVGESKTQPATSDPSPSASSAAESSVMNQDELNALFGGGVPSPHAAPAAPPISPTPVPPPITPPAAATPSPSPLPVAGGWNPSHDSGSWSPPAGSFSHVIEDDSEGIPHGDLDYLAKKAEDSLRSIAATPINLPTEVIEFQFPEFGGTVPSTEHATLDQISEVDLDVKVELGRTYMYIEDVLKLRRGSVVPLDKMAGETVDIYINGRLLARGEVLVMNENFCVRIAELLAGAIPME